MIYFAVVEDGIACLVRPVEEKDAAVAKLWGVDLADLRRYTYCGHTVNRNVECVSDPVVPTGNDPVICAACRRIHVLETDSKQENSETITPVHARAGGFLEVA
jgi:hypothetical protein